MSKSDKVFSWMDAYNFLELDTQRYITFGMIEERETYNFICLHHNNPLKPHKRKLDVVLKITNIQYIEVFW